MTAIVGMIGIRPTIAAIKKKKDIALANKETLVTAGHIIMPLAEQMGVSRQAVSKWESGKSDPSTSNLLMLAKLFKISPEELLREVEQ